MGYPETRGLSTFGLEGFSSLIPAKISDAGETQLQPSHPSAVCFSTPGWVLTPEDPFPPPRAGCSMSCGLDLPQPTGMDMEEGGVGTEVECDLPPVTVAPVSLLS